MSTTELTKAPEAAPPAQRKPGTIRESLESPDFAKAVAMVLPKHLTAERMVRVGVLALTRTPKLANCDRATFFNAMMTLSQLGLEPDGRRAHLIPYENRKRGATECQLIIDYKGLVELVLRSGLVSSLHADVVCENDVFDFDRGLVTRHSIDFKKPRGNVYAVYAICRYKDGTEKSEVMTREDVERIRSRSRSGNSGPWQTDWNEMAKKTVFRRLSKWLVLSPEFRDALEKEDDIVDGEAVASQPQHLLPSASLSQFVEGEIDDDASSPAGDPDSPQDASTGG